MRLHSWWSKYHREILRSYLLTTLFAREYTESVASKPTHPMTARMMFVSFIRDRQKIPWLRPCTNTWDNSAHVHGRHWFRHTNRWRNQTVAYTKCLPMLLRVVFTLCQSIDWYASLMRMAHTIEWMMMNLLTWYVHSIIIAIAYSIHRSGCVIGQWIE